MKWILSIFTLLIVVSGHALQSDPKYLAFIGRQGDKGPLGDYIVNCRGERIYQHGGPVDCSHFCDCDEAEEFFKLAGGPKRDPFYLDRDRDGQPCNQLCSK